MSGFAAESGLLGMAKRIVIGFGLTPVQRYLSGPVVRALNKGKAERRLELGPGPKRIPGFETLNVIGGRQVDYVADATRRLPFPDGVFDTLYASHILEHVAWYKTEQTLAEWVRVLKPGGSLEVWVPDGLKIAEAFVDAEKRADTAFEADGWWRYNEDRDPCAWFSGRVFSYGDGTGRVGHFNWHLAAFSERRLKTLMSAAGLVNVQRMAPQDVRGFDHGWINLGVRGQKAGV